MTFSELQEFIDSQDALFRSLKDTNHSERERVFARTIKLGEEYGELCSEVLASVGDQRKDKLSEKPRDLDGEFADVIIVAFMLAKAMNVDIGRALAKKIKIIKEKHNSQL